MIPRKGHDLSSAIQGLEYFVRGLYIVLGLSLVSSLVCATIAAARVLDRWDVCEPTNCEYDR